MEKRQWCHLIIVDSLAELQDHLFCWTISAQQDHTWPSAQRLSTAEAHRLPWVEQPASDFSCSCFNSPEQRYWAAKRPWDPVEGEINKKNPLKSLKVLWIWPLGGRWAGTGEMEKERARKSQTFVGQDWFKNVCQCAFVDMCQISLVCLLCVCGATEFQICSPHWSGWWLLWEGGECQQRAWVCSGLWKGSSATLVTKHRKNWNASLLPSGIQKINTFPIKVRGESIYYGMASCRPTWLVDGVYSESGWEDSFCYLTDSSGKQRDDVKCSQSWWVSSDFLIVRPHLMRKQDRFFSAEDLQVWHSSPN